MSEFVSELKAAWVGNLRRRFYQATRGIMTPEERVALENDFDRKLAEHDRQVAETAWDELAKYVGSKPGGQDEGEYLTSQNPYREEMEA